MKRSGIERKTPMQRASTLRKPAAEPKPVKGPRPKRCANRECRAEYFPDPKRPYMNWCSDNCALVIALAKLAARKAKEQRTERRETKLKLLAIEPLEYWLKRAERSCNAYIRKRDEGQGCISCGRKNAEVYNAGHFISVGANRTLRFNEDNIHLQCARPCNMDKGGNIHEYRKGLLLKIGADRVAVLDGWHEPVKMTITKAQEVEQYFKDKLRTLTHTNNK